MQPCPREPRKPIIERNNFLELHGVPSAQVKFVHLYDTVARLFLAEYLSVCQFMSCSCKLGARLKIMRMEIWKVKMYYMLLTGGMKR